MTTEQTGKVVTGGCMCGRVRFSATVKDDFSACYCKMCQRWSSGVFMGLHTTVFDVTEGAEDLKIFKSSEWAQRGFCGTCGSNLYYHAPDHGCPSVALGALDSTDGLHVARQYYVDKKPSGFSLSDETNAMTEAETLRYFGVD